MTTPVHPTDHNATECARAEATSPPWEPMATVSSRNGMAMDVRLALDLARGRPTGEAADALRVRLRTYIAALADPADSYAASLADSRARDIVTNTVRHARAVAQDPVHDPAANLRLLAKSVDYLARYAAASRHGGEQ